jgi:hypothetical protein
MKHFSIATTLILVVILVPPSACAQLPSDWPETVHKRIDELRERFAAERTNRHVSMRQHFDEEATVAALVAIIKEEKHGATYHQALSELGNYPQNKAALRTLVENIDTGVPAAPSFSPDPLEHYTAAQALANSGPRARSYILASLKSSQSLRLLHIKAYVLVRLDQAGEIHPFDVTVLRFTRAIKWFEDQEAANRDHGNVLIGNLGQLVEIVRHPDFAVQGIPPPNDVAKP